MLYFGRFILGGFRQISVEVRFIIQNVFLFSSSLYLLSSTLRIHQLKIINKTIGFFLFNNIGVLECREAVFVDIFQ